MSEFSNAKARASALIGSAFLMATSAIGPGFITQTTVFTEKLRTSFGFVILCSIVIDIIVQLTIWRVVSVAGQRTQDIANRTIPGSGYLLSFLIVLGGLAFNIGNIAGAGLGLQVLTDMNLTLGVIISVAISLFIFWYKDAGSVMDLFAKVMGIIMIALTAYIAVSSDPPILSTLQHSVFPEVFDSTAIVVLVGGTVGGYISFAGVHRLLDAGVSGEKNIKEVSQTSIKAILLASTMRVLLFLAALGVITQGAILDPGNPAASVFQSAAGQIGYRIFGLVLWAASITSVVGSAYTSVSFLKTFSPAVAKHQAFTITLFVLISATIFLLVGRPVSILILVGALNAVVLPIALGIILLASGRPAIMGKYRHPRWLKLTGWLAASLLAAMSIKTIMTDLVTLWH